MKFFKQQMMLAMCIWLALPAGASPTPHQRARAFYDAGNILKLWKLTRPLLGSSRLMIMLIITSGFAARVYYKIAAQLKNINMWQPPVAMPS